MARTQLNPYNQLPLLTSQVVVAAKNYFPSITNADFAFFITNYIGNIDDTGTNPYICLNIHPFCPINGTIYNLMFTYLNTGLGIASATATTHLQTIWNNAATTVIT